MVVFINFSKDLGCQMAEMGTILEARTMLPLKLCKRDFCFNIQQQQKIIPVEKAFPFKKNVKYEFGFLLCSANFS